MTGAEKWRRVGIGVIALALVGLFWLSRDPNFDFYVAVTRAVERLPWLDALLEPDDADSAGQKTLLVGEQAPAGRFEIPYAPPVELDGLSRAELLKLRTDAVEPWKHLVSGAYAPSNQVFGGLVDNLPWWGVQGLFVLGPGPKSAGGVSGRSSLLINPFYLAMADLGEWPELRPKFWNDDVEKIVNHPNFPFGTRSSAITWEPQKRLATVTVHASDFIKRLSRFTAKPPRWNGMVFDLNLLNASDWGFRYARPDMGRAVGVVQRYSLSTARRTRDHFRKGASCGQPSGCNNVGHHTVGSQREGPFTSFALTALPSSLPVSLWKKAPSVLFEEPADMTFVVNFD